MNLTKADTSAAWPDPRSHEILDIIARETGTDLALLQPDATIDALGIPSLDLTQAVFELETHFNVEIPVVADRPAGAGAEFATVGDLVRHVIAAIEQAKSSTGKSSTGA
jgi:acyl carrier protein